MAGLLLAMGAVAGFALGACTPVAEEPGPEANTGPLYKAFAAASLESGVPVDLLLAIGWVGSHWNVAAGVEEAGGSGSSVSGSGGTVPSTDASGPTGGAGGRNGRVGIMQLTPHPPTETLPLAAALLDVPVRQFSDDPATNIRGAAAVLRQMCEQTYVMGHPQSADEEGQAVNTGFVPLEVERLTLDQWRDVLALWSGYEDPRDALDYVDAIYATLGSGAGAELPGGEILEIRPYPEFAPATP